MSDACIVCLEDLELQVQVPIPQTIPHDDLKVTMLDEHQPHNHPGKLDNQQFVAQIKPCDHVLHDDCLRMWSQEANSCPICRASFNLVLVLDKVGGTVQSEYAVEDKKQTADFDLAEWQANNPEEYDDDEDTRYCPVCEQSDQEDCLLLCNACDAGYHSHCIGLSSMPRGIWYCMECVEGGAFNRHDDTQGPARTIPHSAPNISRTLASVRRARRNGRQDRWVNAWGQVSNAIRSVAGVDLDFAEDDQEIGSYRDLQQFSAAEFLRWEQRMTIAGRQGAGQTFRAAAPRAVRERIQTPVPEVENRRQERALETREERQAWGAMERAQQLEEAPNRRKRRSVSTQTSRGSSTPEEPERKQKRPRTRIVQNGASSVASSSTNPQPHVQPQRRRSHGSPRRLSRPTNTSDTNAEPTFLSSLLREVEMAPSSDDDSVRVGMDIVSNRANGATSPSLDYSSPATSPASSPRSRALSTTPPPRGRTSRSPPLTTSVMPDFSAVHYSPNRSPPADLNNQSRSQNKRKRDASSTSEIRQPQPRRQKLSRGSQDSSPLRIDAVRTTVRPEYTSPVRNTMSIEEKESINKLVKTALRPHWRSQKISISTEQYADINQRVSRKLYELIADKNVSDGDKSSWEKIATLEVGKAVESLHS